MRKKAGLIAAVILVFFLFQLSLAVAGSEISSVKGTLVDGEIPLRFVMNGQGRAVGGQKALTISFKYSDNEVDLEFNDVVQLTDISVKPTCIWAPTTSKK
jgi:hypothetical protein